MNKQSMGGDFLFATRIGCMDGRVSRPIEEFVRGLLTPAEGQELVIDVIPAPGMDAILAGESNFAPIEQYRKMAEISVEHHGSRLAIVSGHNRCAGNPCTDERHNGHIHKAVETVRGWGLFETVIGVFVDPERDVHIAVPAEESVAVAA